VSFDVALLEPARFYEFRYLRPEGAKTYQPGAKRSAAPGAGNRRIPRPERAKQMANCIDEFRVMFRPFRAKNAFIDTIPRALPWADLWLPLQGVGGRAASINVSQGCDGLPVRRR
jgi:hypothetical protein